MVSTKIYTIIAREILDSRGNPTIETMVVLESGYRGVAAVPAGTSLGKYEARELRDNDETRYGGMGVLKAVAAVNGTISPKLRGFDALDQRGLDQAMRELDGTEDKSKLGANSILSVSLGVAAAAAAAGRTPLYRYLNAMFSQVLPTTISRMPTPTVNVMNGGKHGAGNLDFQEFQIVPASNLRYSDALRLAVEIYQKLKGILKYRNASTAVGYEGGFAPNLYTNLDAMELLQEAVRATPYRFGVDVFFGLDVAASHFKTDRGYQIRDKETPMSPKDFVSYLSELHKKYRLLILEDALDEDDWTGWTELTARFGHEVMIVGDDLLATNPRRLAKAIEQKACTTILLKPNQIGTLSEFFDVVASAKQHGIQTIVSHRSGETNDTIIADLGVAVQADYVKFGGPTRGERVAKYNRLLQIEAELFASK
ncbi:phosphopyruvate hydratase [Candidatus Gottesmanbacteria bacterium]|nr:phosphopyruvate hydratase [Candidatus Gottesmanbacteria bacterium]